MLKAVIFDCFGVLYPNASRNFFEKHKDLFGGDSVLLDKLSLQIDLGEILKAEFFNELGKKTGIPAREVQTEIEQEYIADWRLVELIKKLKTRYKIGLLSNTGEEEIELVYRDKLESLFDGITVSYQLGIVKPEPEIFLSCLKKLGVKPEESLFIDDSKINVESAINLGMQGFAYTDNVSLAEYLAKSGII